MIYCFQERHIDIYEMNYNIGFAPRHKNMCYASCFETAIKTATYKGVIKTAAKMGNVDCQQAWRHKFLIIYGQLFIQTHLYYLVVAATFLPMLH